MANAINHLMQVGRICLIDHDAICLRPLDAHRTNNAHNNGTERDYEFYTARRSAGMRYQYCDDTDDKANDQQQNARKNDIAQHPRCHYSIPMTAWTTCCQGLEPSDH